MSQNDRLPTRWRVVVEGIRPSADDEVEEDISMSAHAWADDNAPSSKLEIEGGEWQRFKGSPDTSTKLTATVDALDPADAIALVRTALEHLLPNLRPTRIVAESCLARPAAADEMPACSFCGKGQRQVKKMIAGPGVYICDECVDLALEITREEHEP